MKDLARQERGGRSAKIERILGRAEHSALGLESAVAEIAVTRLLFVRQTDMEALALKMGDILARHNLATTSGVAIWIPHLKKARSAAVEHHAETAAFGPGILGAVLGMLLFGGSAGIHGDSIMSLLPYAAGILACVTGPIVISQIWYSITKSGSNASDLMAMTLGLAWIVAVFAVAFGTSFLLLSDVPRILLDLWTAF